MKKITRKQIFRITFELASALSIGSGENDQTDKDILLGSDGKPYIPASSIAGVCINNLDAKKTPENRCYREYWGYIQKAGAGQKAKSEESTLIFYDAVILDQSNGDHYTVTIRDSVALDEYKTAIKGAKFDMEVLEPGVKFVTYIEQNFIDTDKSQPELAGAIAELFRTGSITFGGKTSRGYGAIKNGEVQFFEVDFANTGIDCMRDPDSSIRKWLDGTFEEFSWKPWKQEDDIQLESTALKERKFRFVLQQESGISIRKYTTEAHDRKEDSVPDFVQMTTGDGSESDKPVIPGTSWAGAFEHQMKKHLGSAYDENDWDKLFGYVKKNKKQRSKIRFGESMIEGAEPKMLSRNAIDRFTGGAADGALFTEITYYGGTTELEIGIAGDYVIPDQLAKALAASVVDLHYGFMAVGGGTSIGRGLFSMKSIKDDPIQVPARKNTDAAGEFYKNIYHMITGRKEAGTDE